MEQKDKYKTAAPHTVDIEELFAQLTMALEDAATLASDGQAAAQVREAQFSRMMQIAQHLKATDQLTALIIASLGTSDG